MTRHGGAERRGRGWMGAAAALAGVVVLAGGAALAWALPAPLPNLPRDIAARTPDVGRGAYLATAGDCVACHSRPGGAPFAGGAALRTPLGAVYPPNITPDRTHGAGAYTLPEFIRMMRQGVARNGRRLYPAMPYPSYTKTSDADLQDLWAYFQHGVAPSAQPNRPSAIVWPLSIRWPLAFWNKLFLDDTRFRPDPATSAERNRGAYLVEGFEHCGACHTPRGLAFQELASRDDGRRYLSGAELDGQSATNLRANSWTGLGRWSADDVVELLKTGRTATHSVSGQMAEVVSYSTQHLSDADLHAIAVYLKSLGPGPATPAGFAPSGATYSAMVAGRASSGARMYMDSCSACHRWDGGGWNHAMPALAGNTTVLQASPASTVSAILNGARLPATAGAPSALAMPAYGWRYSDTEIAELATFVRNAWGNHALAVTPEDVKRLRKLGQQQGRRPEKGGVTG